MTSISKEGCDAGRACGDGKSAGRPVTIPYRDVKAIVERLVAEGIQPSRKCVRRELGDRGSHQTIGRLIEQAMHELGIPQLGGARTQAHTG
jgi:hypothetical protein